MARVHAVIGRNEFFSHSNSKVIRGADVPAQVIVEGKQLHQNKIQEVIGEASPELKLTYEILRQNSRLPAQRQTMVCTSRRFNLLLKIISPKNSERFIRTSRQTAHQKPAPQITVTTSNCLRTCSSIYVKILKYIQLNFYRSVKIKASYASRDSDHARSDPARERFRP